MTPDIYNTYPRCRLASLFEAEFGTAAARSWGFRPPALVEAIHVEMEVAMWDLRRDISRQFLGT